MGHILDIFLHLCKGTGKHLSSYHYCNNLNYHQSYYFHICYRPFKIKKGGTDAKFGGWGEKKTVICFLFLFKGPQNYAMIFLILLSEQVQKKIQSLNLL